MGKDFQSISSLSSNNIPLERKFHVVQLLTKQLTLKKLIQQNLNKK